MNSSTSGTNFDHFPSHQLLHNITEPQWLSQHPSCTSATTTDESNSLDRIERDEEMYIEQLRSSSLVYRGPSSSSSVIGGISSADHHPQNAGCYPVVGVSSSSKTMSDILLQFHQEAESIDLLSVNALQDDNDNVAGDRNSTVGDKSFFRKYENQFQELFLQYTQLQKGERNSNNMASSINASGYSTDQNRIYPMAANDKNDKHHNNGDDVSHSSSMMMMSMNSSTTTMMSP